VKNDTRGTLKNTAHQTIALMLVILMLAACKANNDASGAVENSAASGTPLPETKKNTASFFRENETLLMEKHADFDGDGIQDTVAVVESPVSATAHQAAHSKRRLLVLHNTQDGLQLTAENEKLIACSKCGQQLDDPFASKDIQLSGQTLTIKQIENNAHPNSVSYEFTFDKATKTWLLSKGEVVRQQQQDSGDWAAERKSLPVTPSLEISKVDGKWSVPQYWNAVVTDKQGSLYTSFFNLESEAALQSVIDEACKNDDKCNVIAKANYGCIAMAQDDKNRLYAANSNDSIKAAVDLVESAMNECKAASGQGCKEVFAECSVGS
jgi:Domain of unknown function (DUF4189)